MVNSSAIGDIFYANSRGSTPETDANFSKNQPLFHNLDEEFEFSSVNSGDQDLDFWQTNSNYSIHDPNAEGPQMFKRELFTRGNFGPGHSTDPSMYNSSSDSSDSVSIYKLPVGVKQLEKSEDTLFTSNTKHGADGKVDDNKKREPQASLTVSLSELMEAGDYSTADFNINDSVLKKGKVISNSKKQGVLSTRAASMLG